MRYLKKSKSIYPPVGQPIFTPQQLEDLQVYCQPGVHRCDIISVVHPYDKEVEQESCARNERWVRRLLMWALLAFYAVVKYGVS